MNLILETIQEVLLEQPPELIYTVSKGHVSNGLIQQVITKANVYNTHLNIQRIRLLLIDSAKNILKNIHN